MLQLPPIWRNHFLSLRFRVVESVSPLISISALISESTLAIALIPVHNLVAPSVSRSPQISSLIWQRTQNCGHPIPLPPPPHPPTPLLLAVPRTPLLVVSNRLPSSLTTRNTYKISVNSISSNRVGNPRLSIMVVMGSSCLPLRLIVLRLRLPLCRHMRRKSPHFDCLIYIFEPIRCGSLGDFLRHSLFFNREMPWLLIPERHHRTVRRLAFVSVV